MNDIAKVSRLGFIRGAIASLGAGFAGRRIFAAPEGWKPPKGANLVFGVFSDTHLRTNMTGLGQARSFPHKYVFAALRIFRKAGVDAVVHCGDMAHRGQILEMQFHADAWNKVFPNNKLPDGRPVERLFVTGNHDGEGWKYGTNKGFNVERAFPDPEERAKHVLATDMAANWEKIWGEKYEPVWHREVKGYQFFGRHWGVPELDLARRVDADAEKCGILGTAKPFFVLSHIRPHAALNRAMARYRNMIGFNGHSHRSAANWNEIHLYNGNPTIQVPACTCGGGQALAGDAWISPAGEILGHTCDRTGLSRQGYIVRVYDDMVVVQRLEFGFGGTLGRDWIFALGKYDPHAFSRDELAKLDGTPQFREGAALVAESAMGIPLKPKQPKSKTAPAAEPAEEAPQPEPVLRITIPNADGATDARVYAYEVSIDAKPADAEKGGGTASARPLLKAVYAAGINMGKGHETAGGTTVLDIPVAELPKGDVGLCVSATPLSSLGNRGKAIAVTLPHPENAADGKQEVLAATAERKG